MNDQENLGATLNCISDIFEDYVYENDRKVRWFIGYGALRFYIAEHHYSGNLDQDIDVCVLDPISRDQMESQFHAFGYHCSKMVVSDVDENHPFQMVFEPDVKRGLTIDVWFQIKANGMYWHTYDRSNGKEAVLKEYAFKGVHSSMFDAGTLLTPWAEIARDIRIPKLFGECLDTWYPPKLDPAGNAVYNSAWFIKDIKYGQSKCDKTVTLKTCRKMEELLK